MQNHIVKAFDGEIDNLDNKITTLAKRCGKQLAGATKALNNLDISLAKNVIKEDAQINSLQREIEDEVVKFIAKRQPMAVDLRHLLSVMKIASELERIGDYAANVAKRVLHLTSSSSSREAIDLILEMARTCQVMILDVKEAFSLLDTQKAVAVWQMDDEIDSKFARLMSLVRTQMQENKDAVGDGTQLIFMGRCCERIGDHITNIAENIYFISTGQNYIDQFEA